MIMQVVRDQEPYWVGHKREKSRKQSFDTLIVSCREFTDCSDPRDVVDIDGTPKDLGLEN